MLLGRCRTKPSSKRILHSSSHKNLSSLADLKVSAVSPLAQVCFGPENMRSTSPFDSIQFAKLRHRRCISVPPLPILSSILTVSLKSPPKSQGRRNSAWLLLMHSKGLYVAWRPGSHTQLRISKGKLHSSRFRPWHVECGHPKLGPLLPLSSKITKYLL